MSATRWARAPRGPLRPGLIAFLRFLRGAMGAAAAVVRHTVLGSFATPWPRAAPGLARIGARPRRVLGVGDRRRCAARRDAVAGELLAALGQPRPSAGRPVPRDPVRRA